MTIFFANTFNDERHLAMFRYKKEKNNDVWNVNAQTLKRLN